MQERALFADAFQSQPFILTRLIKEFLEASREFRENPKSYLVSAFKSDGVGGYRRKMLLRFGLAIGIVVYACFFGAILILWSIHAKAKNDSQTELEVHMINPDDFKPQEIEMPKADKKAGGRRRRTKHADSGFKRSVAQVLADSSAYCAATGTDSAASVIAGS